MIQRGIGTPLSESMADEKLLRRIRKGVNALNEWRDKHREIRELDLRGADLRWAKLHKVNLFGAILYKAKLAGAKLAGANLRASLIKAKLNRADLSAVRQTSVGLKSLGLSFSARRTPEAESMARRCGGRKGEHSYQ